MNAFISTLFVLAGIAWIGMLVKLALAVM